MRFLFVALNIFILPGLLVGRLPWSRQEIRGYKEVAQPKVAVVTGASRGIGMATAKVLCHRLNTGHIHLFAYFRYFAKNSRQATFT